MAIEYINRITVKKDGVYISHKCSNCSEPYRTFRSDILSDAYDRGGQRELDRVVLDIMMCNTSIRGNHKSVVKYRDFMHSDVACDVVEDYETVLDDVFEKYRNYSVSTAEYRAIRSNAKSKCLEKLVELFENS